ncbi:hypothetical protein [Streptomyces natalensis]|nr:hypothetical protein [Streptomyces natalensis]
MTSNATDPTSPSASWAIERTHLRAAAFFGLCPFALTVFIIALGTFPYPENSLNAQLYIDYVLRNHTGEVDPLLWGVALGTMLVFVIHLAVAYMRQAGRVTASGLTMVACMVLTTGVSVIVMGFFGATAMFERGFGTKPADLRFITFIWDTMDVAYNSSLVPLVMMWIAVIVANRRNPILPRALGLWGAAVAALANFIALGSVFINGGHWSAGGAYSFILHAAPTFGWVTITSVYLLRKTAKFAATPSGERGQ